jgi:N-acetylglucosaminyldiphosphoundecaprenol N-acetyl-beta-D-mannosaminyltransferase
MKIHAATDVTNDFPILVHYNDSLIIATTPEFLKDFTIDPSDIASVSILLPTVKDLFRFGTIDKKAQKILESRDEWSFSLTVAAKSPLYFVEKYFPEGKVTVRFAHSEAELQFITNIKQPLVLFELSKEVEFTRNTYPAVKVEGNFGKSNIDISSGTPKVVKGNDDTLFFFEEYPKFKGKGSKFPLFRQEYISILWLTRKKVLDMIFDRTQKRFQEGRSLQTIKPGAVVTPNLDHLRMLVEGSDEEFREVYSKAFIQVPDGYPPLVRFAKESIGYQTIEQVSGVDIFVSIMNTIGQEDLPYTVYFVGGFQRTAYKVRDHFVSAYPNMREKIVGVSEPPMGFMKDEKIFESIVSDIDKKKPDFVFVCLAAPHQEKFVLRLMNRNINFGLGFGLGRTFDLISGYQKKEPRIIEKLKLVALYRAFTKKAYAERFIKDMVFAIKTYFSA